MEKKTFPKLKSQQNNMNIAVQLKNVSKKYEIHHEKPTLVEKILKKTEIFWALKNFSTTIEKGEKVAIIGPNGSGKTTLLKLISGITTQTSGTIKTNGNVISLIDLEAGFHMDLTGIQNIYLNGLLLGMRKEEVDSKRESIIGFADIKQFIDIPVFTYSQGMKLRLSFAIAAHANPEILILDENIAVGDADFQKKSNGVIDELFSQNKTIIVVTHYLDFVKSKCNSIILLKNGEMIAKGGKEVLSLYKKTTRLT